MKRVTTIALKDGTFKDLCAKFCELYKCILIHAVIICLKECTGSVSVTDLYKIKNDSYLPTTNPMKFTRSLLECSKYCVISENCCGFNYNKPQKSCTLLYEFDFTDLNYAPKLKTGVYLHKICEYLYDEVSSTTVGTPTTTSLETTMQTSTDENAHVTSTSTTKTTTMESEKTSVKSSSSSLSSSSPLTEGSPPSSSPSSSPLTEASSTSTTTDVATSSNSEDSKDDSKEKESKEKKPKNKDS